MRLAIAWPFLFAGFMVGIMLFAATIHIEYTFGEAIGVLRRFD